MDYYAPAVSCTTMQMLMMLMVGEKHTKLAAFTNAFAQAKLKETVYVELTKLYESPGGSDMVLKLNNYGLVQALLCWYSRLREGLIAEDFLPSELDPCLYFGHGRAVLTYVDECIFFDEMQEDQCNYCKIEEEV